MIGKRTSKKSDGSEGLDVPGAARITSSKPLEGADDEGRDGDSVVVAEDGDRADLGEDNAEIRTKRSGKRSTRKVSVSVRALVCGFAIAGLVIAVGVLAALYVGERSKVDTTARLAAQETHAEQLALDYAVRAAVMDFNDLAPWRESLVQGTSPELNAKLTKAATAMEEILVPMQWTSTATPIAAKIRRHDNGVFVVDCFVSVLTNTAQSSDSIQSTATYSVTVDSASNWQITDVGGIASVVGDK